jgi:hypothetical protein
LKYLLAHHQEDDRVASSPYFASIIIGSLFWVFWTWATKLLRGEPNSSLAIDRADLPKEHPGTLGQASVSPSPLLAAAGTFIEESSPIRASFRSL